MDKNPRQIQSALSFKRHERSVMVFSGSWIRLCVLSLGLTVLAACAVKGDKDQRVASPILTQRPGGLHFKPQDKVGWEAVTLPSKLRTAFKLEKHDQREALSAHAQASASMLRQRLNVPETNWAGCNLCGKLTTCWPRPTWVSVTAKTPQCG